MFLFFFDSVGGQCDNWGVAILFGFLYSLCCLIIVEYRYLDIYQYKVGLNFMEFINGRFVIICCMDCYLIEDIIDEFMSQDDVDVVVINDQYGK